MADWVAYNEMMERCRGGAEEHSGFTPFLPDEVFRNCLVRVPLQWHANLQRVSQSVRALLQTPEYYVQRKSEGASSSFVCMLQPLPCEENSKGAPVFGITLLDVQTGAWERLPAIPGLAGGLPTFAKLVAVERDLVVMGGLWQSSWEPSRSVFVYDFSTQRWRQGADMPSARSMFACGALGSQRVVVAGGHDGEKQALATADCYDVETNSWSPLPSMRCERDEPTGVALDGKLYVVSGYESNTQGVFATSGECYDPATNSWRFVEEMWAPVNPSSFAALAGNLFGVRGKEVVVYCPDRNVWTVVEKVPEECEKGEMTSTAITASGNALVITGLVRKNEVASLRTLKLTPALGKCKAHWETIACNEQFLNLAQTSCAFEL